MNLSPDRIAVVGPTYEQAHSHARESGLLGSPGVVIVSLSGHPGSIAGMSFKQVIRVGDQNPDTDTRDMARYVRDCQERFERRRRSTPEIS